MQVSLFIIPPGFFQKPEATIELVFADDINQLVGAVTVISNIANQFIINSLLIFVLAQAFDVKLHYLLCLLYTSPSPRDATLSRMPSSA